MPLLKKKRPTSVPTITTKVRTGEGTMYVRIGYIQPKQPFEVFATIGHNDPCERAYLEALTRMISTALRFYTPIESIISQLEGIKCVPQPDPEGGYIESPADGIAKVLKRFIA